MKRLIVFALIVFFSCTLSVYGEELPLAPQPPAESAPDHGLNIIRVQLIPKDSPLPNAQKGPQDLEARTEAISQCGATKDDCINVLEGKELTPQEYGKYSGCCRVTYFSCMQNLGAFTQPTLEANLSLYPTWLENCYSQATPELQEQVLQQCNAGLDSSQQKLLKAWTPHHIRSNKTTSLSYKKAQI